MRWMLSFRGMHFNPRSREGSDGISDVLFEMDSHLFQSTLPRGERPVACDNERYLPNISIHAPARGATLSKGANITSLNISIHAPARGAT